MPANTMPSGVNKASFVSGRRFGEGIALSSTAFGAHSNLRYMFAALLY